MFKVLKNDSPLAARVASALIDADTRTNYNALAAAFNALTPEAGQLMFPWKREKSAALLQQLSERGLIRGTDFSLQFYLDPVLDKDGNPVLEAGKPTHTENAVITRVNFTSTMKIVAPHKRGPRKASATAPAGQAKPVADAPVAAKK